MCYLPCVFLSSCPSAVPTRPPLPGTMPCGMPTGTDPREASVAPGHRSCPERTQAQTLQCLAVSRRALSALIYTDHSVATLPSVGSHDGIFLDFLHIFLPTLSEFYQIPPGLHPQPFSPTPHSQCDFADSHMSRWLRLSSSRLTPRSTSPVQT